MKVLLTGAGGMLGSAFSVALQDVELVCAGRSQLTVTEPRKLFTLIDEIRPSIVVNCAAHVDLEAAERDPDAAYSANWILPGILAAACRRQHALIVHFSSTGCYGREKQEPYSEEDPLRPTTVYHRSKVLGEDAIKEAGCEFLILRTGWLFGGGPTYAKNFVWKRLLEALTSERMISDASQTGNPTFVGDVVRQTLLLVDLGLRGTYNCASRGSVSRFEYVRRIVQTAGLPCSVEPTTTPFPRLARVSPNEAVVNHRLRLLGIDIMPEWGKAVDAYVTSLTAAPEWRAVSKGSLGA
jgi:dTDP-4-dehydrorhamnose reductase